MKIKLREALPNLWCPFCGEQIIQSGIKKEANHYIDNDIAEDIKEEQKTVLVTCKNCQESKIFNIQITIKP